MSEFTVSMREVLELLMVVGEWAGVDKGCVRANLELETSGSLREVCTPSH